ncbi:putative ribonuclease H-like domain-containing protein, partial [Tanacetum coccineum]
NASNDEPQPSSDAGKKNDEGVCKESRINDQERPENSTQSVNTEPDMFSLGDNVTLEATHANFFGDEIEVDMRNITTTYPVPSTPNIRIHKDHSLYHVIGGVQSGVQIRRMTKTTNEQGFISVVYEGKTHEDLYTCLFACFLSQKEPKKHGKRAIGTKWVYRNKKDERVARIEAIGLFLAYASFMNFVVYQMDVKSAFLYGKIEKEVYVCQPLGFEDPEFPDRVYKKDDGIFMSQDKYVDEILKKFGFSTVKTASTPMETSKPLMKDENAEDVDVHLYRSMIGSLMYLTSSRPDIMFAVCACARFQVTPKVSHLHAMKRIFRYLKGQPKLGLWYPKDSPFDLEAYTDSDYAGASLDRKSTTRGCQFLGSRLISWQCKKQTIVANSTTKAKYVAVASFKNPVFHSKTKHIKIRHHFIRDSNEKKLIQIIKIHTDQNVADLLTKAFDVSIFQYLIATNDEIQVITVGLTFYCLRRKHKKETEDKNTKFTQPNGSTEPITDEAANEEHVPTHSNDPLFSGEDRLQLKELLELCTKLSERVLDLENTKTSQAAEITKLKERVKKLERRNKSRTPGLKRLRKVGRSAQVVSSKDEGLGAQEDASKQGRKITDLDADAEEVEVEKVVSTAEVTTVSATTTIVDELTLAQTLIEIKAAKPKTFDTNAVLQQLQSQLNADIEEEEKLAKQREEDANIAEWDTVQDYG